MQLVSARVSVALETLLYVYLGMLALFWHTRGTGLVGSKVQVICFFSEVVAICDYGIYIAEGY